MTEREQPLKDTSNSLRDGTIGLFASFAIAGATKKFVPDFNEIMTTIPEDTRAVLAVGVAVIGFVGGVLVGKIRGERPH